MKSTFPAAFFRLAAVFAAAILCTLPARADYTTHPEVAAFVETIAARNKLDTAQIYVALARANYNPRVVDLIRPPAKRTTKSWRRYRSRFLDRLHIDAGLQAWAQYEDALNRAERQYGVPAEIILGILGVETIYGRNTGNFETLSALATLAFDYPPRADLFRGELEALFLLAREQGRDPASYSGSFAGALGWPQFLPSSVRRYAVDFDGDGRIDFDTHPIDAIGSIANYLREFGWVSGGPVALRARLDPGADPAPLVATGFEPTLDRARIAASGIRPAANTFPDEAALLIDLETPDEATQYWLGYRNFYAITRYNHSYFYAMAVFQLAQALREGRDNPLAPPQYVELDKHSHAPAHKHGKAVKTKKMKPGKKQAVRNTKRRNR
ncbi:MAG: lytic murein transglycosylase B [Azoarcus sp.]|jgi:membrane-bound lytic murein transglycosylase B|nr:lytic murein transglycosylase B [Azoarcus sp.]